jgi:dienelactone hydrolase
MGPSTRVAPLLALLLVACATPPAVATDDATVMVPWRAGNAALFEVGTPAEHGARAATGELPVRLTLPAGAGPFPFVVLLHGCGGLRHDAMWTEWVAPWAAFFRAHGVGTAVVDSFAPRGIDEVCTRGVAYWAVRRADDAESVAGWLAQRPYVAPGRIAVMGMSNGGRTVLAALRANLAHEPPFAAGIALYPGCRSDRESRFYAPLLVLIGRGDQVTPAADCEAMKAGQPPGAPPLELVVYPGAPHTFDMRLPPRRVLGMRLGPDEAAAADARRRVLAFLVATGVIGGGAGAGTRD